MHTTWISKTRLEKVTFVMYITIHVVFSQRVQMKINISTLVSVAFLRAAFGPGTDPIWLDNVDCAGEEVSLFECFSRPPGEHDCGHLEDASVGCSCMYTVVKFRSHTELLLATLPLQLVLRVNLSVWMACVYCWTKCVMVSETVWVERMKAILSAQSVKMMETSA